MASEKKGKNKEVDLEKITQEAVKAFSKESVKIIKEIDKANKKQLKLLENRNKTKNKEDKDRVDNIIDENARKIRGLMEEYNSGVASFWDEWTDEEKKAFVAHSKMIDETVNDTEEAIDKIRGKLKTSIEEVTDEMDDSFSGLVGSFQDQISETADKLREWSNALNLNSLVESTKENIDSYYANLRQVRVTTGSWFDEEGFNKATTEFVKKSLTYNRSEASEFAASMVNEFALKSMDMADDYIAEIGAAAKTWDMAASDFENIMWKDSYYDYQGKLVRQVNNMAATLEDDQYLNVKAGSIISKVNDNIDAILSMHAGDEKRQKGLLKSVIAIEAIQQTAASEGVTTISEKFSEWSRKSIPELLEDDEFLAYSNVAGISARQFYDMAASGDMTQAYTRLQDALNARAGDNEYAAQYNLHQLTKDMGFSDWADINSFRTYDRDKLIEFSTKAGEDADKAIQATEAGQSLASDKGQESLTKLEKYANELSVSKPITNISDFLGKLGLEEAVSLSKAADLALLGSGLLTGGKNLILAGEGVKYGKGFLGKLGGLGKGLFGVGPSETAKAAAEAEKAAKGGKGLLSKLKGLFSKGASSADDVAEAASSTSKSGFFSKLKSFFKVGARNADDVAEAASKSGGFFSKLKNLFKIGSQNADDVAKAASKGGIFSKLGGLLKNTKFASFLGSSGKLANVGKVAGKASGVLSAIFAVVDGIGGVKNAKKWTGGNKLSDKVSSFFGGLLGGTGPGLGEKGKKSDKFWNLLGGAGKGAAAGAAVGSVVPVLGTAIGAVVGAVGGTVLSAIGGDRIARFFKSAGEVVSSHFQSIGTHIQDAGQAFAGRIDDWRTSLNERWENFGKSISSWRDRLSNAFSSARDWLGNTKVGKWFSSKKKKKAKGYARGLSEVPFDEYPAMLHKGEAVLTANQADRLRNADGGIGFSEWKDMSIPELMKNKGFIEYSAKTGESAREIYEASSKFKKAIDSTTSILELSNERDYNLDIWKDKLGFSGYKDLDSFSQSFNRGEAAKFLMDVMSDKGLKKQSNESTEEGLLTVVKDIRNKLVRRFFSEDKSLSRMIRNFNENGLLGNVLSGGSSSVLQKLTKGIFGSSGLGKDISNLISGKGTGGALMSRLKKLLSGLGSNDKKKTTSSGSSGSTGSSSSGSSNAGGSSSKLLSYHPNIEGSGAERWRDYVKDALEANGLSSKKEMQDKVIKQIKSESGGDPKAVNNWDSNAKNGTPSKGLLQVIDPTFNTHKFKGHNNIFNGYDNMLAAIHYAKGRYGKTLMNKDGQGIGSGKGYAVGTPFVPNDQVALIHQGEMIVPADQNPMNNATSTVSLPTGNSDNTQVIETMKWQVSRLESKLDRLISAVESSGSSKRRMPRQASDELNEAFSSVKRPGMGVL